LEKQKEEKTTTDKSNAPSYY